MRNSIPGDETLNEVLRDEFENPEALTEPDEELGRALSNKRTDFEQVLAEEFDEMSPLHGYVSR